MKFWEKLLCHLNVALTQTYRHLQLTLQYKVYKPFGKKSQRLFWFVIIC